MAVWAALFSDSPERLSIWILNIQWCRQWLKYTGYNGTNVKPLGIQAPLPSKLPISFQSHSSLSYSHSLCLDLCPLSFGTLWWDFSSALSVCLTLSLIIIYPWWNVFAHYLFLWLFHGLHFSLSQHCKKKTVANFNKISKIQYFYFANGTTEHQIQG